MTTVEDRPLADGGAVREPKRTPRQNDVIGLVLFVGAILAFGFVGSFSTVAIILALIFMIFMHELGHYLTAKAAGMKVSEFFIFFGPRIWSFRRGETEYGLKSLPFGAYVKILGMSNLETDVDPADEPSTYRQQPYWRRMSVALAGSGMHFLMAIVLMFTILSVVGIPTPVDAAVVGEVPREEDPAGRAGLAEGDRIVAIDGVEVEDFAAMTRYVRARPGEEVTLDLERGGEVLEIDVTLAEETPTGEERGFLGVAPAYETEREGVLGGAGRAVTDTGRYMWLSVKGLASVFSPGGITRYVDTVTTSPSEERTVENGGDGFVSPVGAVRIANQAADAGFANLLFFLFGINVFVGVFNLVPLLPLDGGHVAIATYERIRSRKGRPYRADVAKLLPLTYAVVLVLVVVGISALYLDIARPLNLD